MRMVLRPQAQAIMERDLATGLLMVQTSIPLKKWVGTNRLLFHHQPLEPWQGPLYLSLHSLLSHPIQTTWMSPVSLLYLHHTPGTIQLSTTTILISPPSVQQCAV